jgi:hypothetical protein
VRDRERAAICPLAISLAAAIRERLGVESLAVDDASAPRLTSN